MRRNGSKKDTRGARVVRRGLQLALVSTGLVTAIAAAQLSARPLVGDGGMARAIIAQQVAAGQLVKPGSAAPKPATSPPAGPPTSAKVESEAETRESILAEAATLEAQMDQTLKATAELKTLAYQAKDIIKMNFITSKLDEMTQIMKIAESAFTEIRKPGQDIFVMRAKLTIIRQGADQMKQALAAALATSQGDLGESSGEGSSNVEGSGSKGETDPTTPANPLPTFERPTEASPYK